MQLISFLLRFALLAELGQLDQVVLADDVKGDRAQQDQTLDDLLQVGVKAEDGHAVVEDTHDHRADKRAADRTGAAVRRSAADEAAGDGVHFKALTGSRGGAVQARRKDQAGNRSDEGHIGIGEEHHLLGLDTGQTRSLHVAADGIEMTALDGLLGEEGVDRQQDAQDDQDGRDAAIARQQIEHADNDDGDDRALDHDGAHRLIIIA